MHTNKSHLIQREHSRSVGSKTSPAPELNESVASAGSEWRDNQINKWNKTQKLLMERVCTCCLCTNSPHLDLLWSCPPSPSSSVLLRFRLRRKQWSSLRSSCFPWLLTSPSSGLSSAGSEEAKLDSDDSKLGLKVWEKEKGQKEKMMISHVTSMPLFVFKLPTSGGGGALTWEGVLMLLLTCALKDSTLE